MKVVKKTPEYTIYEKRSRRYAIKGADKKWINADDKIKILLAEKLIEIKLPQPKPVEKEASAGEAATEAETAGETPSAAPAEES